eukprot:9504059-Pyramimonas_sp.AAC.1
MGLLGWCVHPCRHWHGRTHKHKSSRTTRRTGYTTRRSLGFRVFVHRRGSGNFRSFEIDSAVRRLAAVTFMSVSASGSAPCLGGGLGGVPDCVEQVGDLADGLGLLAHLHDATGVVRDGPEDVHREHVRRRRQHAHRRHRRAKQPADRLPGLVHQPGGLPPFGNRENQSQEGRQYIPYVRANHRWGGSIYST